VDGSESDDDGDDDRGDGDGVGEGEEGNDAFASRRGIDGVRAWLNPRDRGRGSETQAKRSGVEMLVRMTMSASTKEEKS
jgi:hypothetical protein